MWTAMWFLQYGSTMYTVLSHIMSLHCRGRVTHNHSYWNLNKHFPETARHSPWIVLFIAQKSIKGKDLDTGAHFTQWSSWPKLYTKLGVLICTMITCSFFMYIIRGFLFLIRGDTHFKGHMYICIQVRSYMKKSIKNTIPSTTGWIWSCPPFQFGCLLKQKHLVPN